MAFFHKYNRYDCYETCSIFPFQSCLEDIIINGESLNNKKYIIILNSFTGCRFKSNNFKSSQVKDRLKAKAGRFTFVDYEQERVDNYV